MGLLTDSLTGPGNQTTVQAPGAAPIVPPMPVAPSQPTLDTSYEQGGDHPSLLDKILNRVMPTSRAYQGILTPQEVGEARRRGLMTMGLSMLANSGPVDGHNTVSTAQALGQGAMQGLGAYDQQQQQQLAQLGQAVQMRQNAHILAVRSQAQQMFQPQQGETQPQMLQRLAQQSAFLGANGDKDGADAVARAAEALKLPRGAYGATPGQRIESTTAGLVGIDPQTLKPTVIMGPDGKPLVSTVANNETLSLAERKAALDAANDKHEDTMDERVSRQFTTRNAKDIELMHNMGGVAALLDQADKGDQYSLNALPGAISSVLDSKARSGPFLLEKLGQFGGQSLVGKIQNAMSTGAWGTITPKDRADIRQAVTAVYNTRKAHLDTDYDNTVGNRPGAIGYAGTKESIYGVPQFDQVTAAPSGNAGAAGTGTTGGNAGNIDKLLNPNGH